MLKYGFIKASWVKFKKKIQEKPGSGWVGQTPTRICLFFNLISFFSVHISKKKLDGGWLDLVWPSEFFFNFFNLTRPLSM